MSAASAFESIEGVRACVVGDNRGRVFEEIGAGERGPELATAAAALMANLERAGARFDLGPLDVVTSYAPDGSWVMGSQHDWTLVVQVDPQHPTEEVEAALRNGRWASMLEWDTDTSPPPTAEVLPFEDGESGTVPFSDFAIPIHVSLPPPEPSSETPVFAGDLKMFPLVDLLEFLGNARRTGLLTCTLPDRRASIALRTGWVIGATHPGAKELDDYLVAQGMTTPHELAAFAIANGRKVGRELALLLVQREIVTLPQARSALEQQIRATLALVLSWNDGQFAFEPERAGIGELSDLDRELEFDSRGLLLEILRQQDEAAAREL